MQQEIEVAEKSLAATEEPLRLDASMLHMALELADGLTESVLAEADRIRSCPPKQKTAPKGRSLSSKFRTF